MQHKLKSSQKEKVKQFMGFTQANEKTAIACLTQHDWRLDIASDRFFQNAELYFRDSQPRQVPVDWKKVELLFMQYKGSCLVINNMYFDVTDLSRHFI